MFYPIPLPFNHKRNLVSYFRWFMIKRKHDRLQPFVDSHEHCKEVSPVRHHGLMFNPPHNYTRVCILGGPANLRDNPACPCGNLGSRIMKVVVGG